MDLQLRIAPARVLAHLAAAKAVLRAADLLRRAAAPRPSPPPAPSSLRVCGGSSSSVRPEHLVGEPVRERDVIERDLDVAQPWSAVLRRCCTSRWCWCSSAIASIRVRYFS